MVCTLAHQPFLLQIRPEFCLRMAGTCAELTFVDEYTMVVGHNFAIDDQRLVRI